MGAMETMKNIVGTLTSQEVRLYLDEPVTTKSLNDGESETVSPDLLTQ